MTATMRIRLGVGLVMSSLLVACGDDPSFPMQPSPPAGPGGAAPATVTNLSVEGPGTLAPGESAQFSATAKFSDGTIRDVTAEARWSSTDSSVLSLESPGRFAARAPGEAQASAAFQGGSHSRFVVSVPKGLVVLRGRVRDATSPTTPVFGARVEVTRGETAGLTSTTDFYGAFVFYGVSVETELRITKDGFAPQTRSLRVVEHRTEVIDLSHSRERPDVRGTYKLTIGGGTCEGGASFPEELRTRIYRAVVYQDDVSLLIDLKDTEFVTVGKYGDRILGQLLLSDATFDLGDFAPPWDYGVPPSYPTVVERLPKGLLFLSGRIVANLTPTGMSGTLDGAITVHDALPVGAELPRAICRSKTHTFRLER
jgi:hypothetical protein